MPIQRHRPALPVGQRADRPMSALEPRLLFSAAAALDALAPTEGPVASAQTPATPILTNNTGECDPGDEVAGRNPCPCCGGMLHGRLTSILSTGIDGDDLPVAKSTVHRADRVWQNLPALPQVRGLTTHFRLEAFQPFSLNPTELRRKLLSVPMENLARGGVGYADNAKEVSIPTPEGMLARFRIAESPILDPELAAKFPEIKTYAGFGVDDPAASIRLSFTPLGLHASVLSPGSSYYIDPYYHLNQSVYASYYRRDARPTDLGWECLAHDHDIAGAANPVPNTQPSPDDGNVVQTPSGTQLRTYRAAVAANGEYTQFWGGTVSAGLSAVTVAMNRVNQVYENDLSIRMTLVANNNLLIYTNPATDPYTNDTGALSQNQTNVDTVIGNANYDIGHVFTTGSGGIAGLGVVGVTGSKARGTTGLPNPSGDPFYIDFVAHEIGHQFGANHTFNTSSAGGNRNGSTAYEPGSGSTIMAYAGITGPNSDLQPFSDPYFHFHSIQEIVTRSDNVIPGVGTRTNTGNTLPTVNAGPDFTIPASTPFALTGTATDPDGPTLTYTWEQRDLGAAQLLNAADNGFSPLFRSFLPTTNPTRMFPKLSSVLAGITADNAGERLPTTNRQLNFRLTVRDNRLNGGATRADDVRLTVVNTGAAFAITNFNSGSSINANSQQTLNWNVAGTTANGINVANVKISMSTDGGQTFPFTLAASTANDGSETVTIPNVVTSLARFKVEAVGNVFFDINNASITVNSAPLISSDPGQPALLAVSDTGQFDNDHVTRFNNSSPAAALQFTVPGTIAGATVQIFADGNLIGSTVAAGATTTVVTNGAFTLPEGTSSITARQTEPGKLQSGASPTRALTVDSVAPTGGFLAFDRNVAPHQLRVLFNEDVGWSLAGGDLSITNDTGGASAGAPSVSFAANIGTFTFPGRPAGLLDRGNYSASIAAADVQDVAGNPLASSPSLAFFFLPGDANGDRSVTIADFSILAANFNQVGNFSAGDFNYSGTVEIGDFSILAAAFNTSLPTPGSLPRAASGFSPGGAPAGGRAVFSTLPVDEDRPNLAVLEPS